MLPRRRIPQSQGEGHDAGRQPLLAAQELRFRVGRRGHRLPLRGAARGHHRGGDHRVRRQGQEELHHQRPRRFRRPPSSLLGELRCGRDPAGDGGEHEPRAAVRPRVDGRRLLRGEERRVRRRGRAGRRHGAHHPRPHIRHRTVDVSGGGLHVTAPLCTAASAACTTIRLDAGSADAEQPGGRSKQ